MEINIFELIHLLLRKLWILILSALICSGLAFCYSYFSLTALYTSSAKIYINNSSLTNYDTKISSADITAAESLVNNVVAIVKSRTVAKMVYEDVDKIYDQGKIQDMVSANVLTNTVIVEISVECDDPEKATKITQSYVDNSKNRIEKIITNSGIEIVDEPSMPKNKSFPNHKLFILLGLIAGFVIAAVAVVVMDILDTKIDSAEDFEETFPEIPIIGIIPSFEEV